MLRRGVLLASPLLLAFGRRRDAAAAESDAAAVAVVERFYADLLGVMKEAKRLAFEARYTRLLPSVTRSFDLPLMTRLAIGPGWTQIAPEQQRRLVDVFSRYTVSVYAGRFDDFNGERFEVSPKPAPGPNGVTVSSRLVKSNGEAVELNYLMRQDPSGAWKIIDVYLSGSISELATRRSEFTAVLRRDGVDGLVRMLEQRTAALRTG